MERHSSGEKTDGLIKSSLELVCLHWKKKEGWTSISKSQGLFYSFSTELKDKYDTLAEFQTLGVGLDDL